MKAEQIYSGEPFKLDGGSIKIACCDCGLTHQIKIRRHKNRGYYLTFNLDNRTTAAFRRHMKRRKG